MAQLRYWDFLSPVSYREDNFVNYALASPGIYSGLELGINISDQLELSPGHGLQPDGILWKETTPRVLGFSVPPGPEDFTVIATHVDQSRIGGSEVEYSIELGIIPYDGVTDGVVVGYIFYSGSMGSPLTADMLLSAPRIYQKSYTDLSLIQRPSVYAAEFHNAYYDAAASGPNTSLDPRKFLSAGSYLIYQEAANALAAPGPEQLVQHFTPYLENNLARPRTISIYCNVPNSPNNQLIVQVYDTDQVLVPLTGSPIVNTTGYENRTVTLDFNQGTWDQDKSWSLRLIYQMDPGQTIGVGVVKINHSPYPA